MLRNSNKCRGREPTKVNWYIYWCQAGSLAAFHIQISYLKLIAAFYCLRTFKKKLLINLASITAALISQLFCGVIKASECEQWVAKIASSQGVVEIRRTETDPWSKVYYDQELCAGDTVRVLTHSRAALYLSNGTVLRLSENTTVILPAALEEKGNWLNLVEGIGHFISRIRQSFEVVTPFVNAAVEGTEFVVEVNKEKAQIIVFEGKVRAVNPQGEVVLTAGQAAEARLNQAPILRVLMKPRNAVQWALYYPPLGDLATLGLATIPHAWQRALKESTQFYLRGDAGRALSMIENLPGDIADSQIYTYRASLALAVGLAGQALQDINRALAQNPNNGDALALQSIISLISNDTEQALQLAEQAIKTADPGVAPWMALSYAYQSQFRIDDALNAARQAEQRSPNNGLAAARSAELLLAQGKLAEALHVAQRAVELDGKVSRTQTVLGFAQLTRIETTAAQQSFNKAIQLDQADPLPHLGLGLAIIREGNLAEGRRHLEVAASLDPNNSLIRSYLGKAYYEEERNPLAASQFAMAKLLDPNDPTPWLYSGILAHSESRPIQATQDINQSVELNDNRAVYRSRLLLDDDLGTRSASVGRIYRDIGFEQMARTEGWKSLAAEPTNYSAHRLLADSYANLPRHEVASVSEMLQAQLLQPFNINPISPQQAEADLLVLQGSGPSLSTLNEYNSLFQRDRVTFLASGLAGSNDTRGSELLLWGTKDQVAFGAGRYFHESQGFHENNDVQQKISNAFLQWRASPSFSSQLEIRNRDFAAGDIKMRFYPEDINFTLRRNIEENTTRLGFNYTPSLAHHYLVSVINIDGEELQRQGPVTRMRENNGNQIEVQRLYSADSYKTIIGIASSYEDSQITDIITFRGIPTKPKLEPADRRQINGHFYALTTGWRDTAVTLGLSYDRLEQQNGIERQQWNPKLGILLSSESGTTWRFAAFRTTKRSFLINQTVEPTHIAGFNQFFDDTTGTNARRYGLGVDQRLSKDFSAGAELTARDLNKFIFKKVGTAESVEQESQQEQFHRLYALWAPSRTLAFSAEYQFEDFSRAYIVDEASRDFLAAISTQSVPLMFSYFHPQGLTMQLKTTWVDQHVEFVSDPGTNVDSDNFWLTDFSLGYRWKRYASTLAINVKNVFDQAFAFESTNFESGTPRATQLYPERAFFIAASFNF